MRKTILLLGIITLSLGVASCGAREEKSDQEVDGKLLISIRNLYFNEYTGGDNYIKKLEDKFKVSFELSTYDWTNWTTQVNGAINGDNMTDVFHANIDSYNFAQLYKFWAEEEMIKPLPKDLSKWPNIKHMIDNTSSIESLKLDGVLYGIPIAKNTTDFSTSFSPFTYVYRRDWAKELGVYQENDEYTWEQFKALLEKFRVALEPTNRYALSDVEWGFPSITNFYKQVPHCFAQDANGNYVNNYTTNEYIAGLEESKLFMQKGWYHPGQNSSPEGTMRERYVGNQLGVFYENLSYENYLAIRQKLRISNASVENFNLDDASAIMKIKNTNGKYCLEGTDNWFSMTFFDYKISQEKQNRILDIIDWLLSEEGTRYAIYGIEDYDYVMENGKIEIVEERWKNEDGTKIERINGAKRLRYLASLGYDTLTYDPMTEEDVIAPLTKWEAEMKKASQDGELYILEETQEVKWLTSEKKSLNSGQMRTLALDNAMKFIYNTIETTDGFKATFGNIWDAVLSEINRQLGK